ncbi:sulfotransferase domain-containing protein, partial [Candidatus Sumerlaeota bacterium]|nr:sulfotransferase domain-containing protein [Candidatus Sumerlaeota bacterium]
MIKEPLKISIRAGRAILSGSRSKVYQTSIPKSGTHLLSRALEAFGFSLGLHQPFRDPNPLLNFNPEELRGHARRIFRGEYILEHLTWKKEAEEILLGEGLKIVFIYRDPRAAAVSYAHLGPHMNEHHPLFAHFNSLDGFKGRLRATLDGVPGKFARDGVGRCAWGELMDAFLPWRNSANVFSVRFEDLVGPGGGGETDRQREVLAGLAARLGLPDAARRAEEAAGKIFDKSALTFRVGHRDAWRSEVDAETLDWLNQALA